MDSKCGHVYIYNVKQIWIERYIKIWRLKRKKEEVSDCSTHGKAQEKECKSWIFFYAALLLLIFISFDLDRFLLITKCFNFMLLIYSCKLLTNLLFSRFQSLTNLFLLLNTWICLHRIVLFSGSEKGFINFEACSHLKLYQTKGALKLKW